MIVLFASGLLSRPGFKLVGWLCRQCILFPAIFLSSNGFFVSILKASPRLLLFVTVFMEAFAADEAGGKANYVLALLNTAVQDIRSKWTAGSPR